MRNVLIIDAIRINNNQWNPHGDTLESFDQECIHRLSMSLHMVQMLDFFIVTHNEEFKLIKCRAPNMPDDEVLHILDFPHVLKQIEQWQSQ